MNIIIIAILFLMLAMLAVFTWVVKRVVSNDRPLVFFFETNNVYANFGIAMATHIHHSTWKYDYTRQEAPNYDDTASLETPNDEWDQDAAAAWDENVNGHENPLWQIMQEENGPQPNPQEHEGGPINNNEAWGTEVDNAMQ